MQRTPTRLPVRLPARSLHAAVLAAALVGQTASARAACPMELAVYEEPETGAMIDFRPGRNATVTNAFRMVFDKGVVLEGVVMWDDGVARPVGMLTHGCPEGDATGEELAACTVWQGVIYAADAQGNVGPMPPEGTAAPKSLILADLGRALAPSPAYAATGLEAAPWDVFTLHGCQE